MINIILILPQLKQITTMLFISCFYFLVHLVGKYEDNIFEERDVIFTTGEGCEANIIPGVEHAIEKFKKNETSCLIIKPQYAFGSTGNTNYNIPPNATVEYIVTLKNFEKAKESWSLDAEEKVEQSKLFKEKGTAYFKAGKYELAIKLYKKIQLFLESEKGKRGRKILHVQAK